MDDLDGLIALSGAPPAHGGASESEGGAVEDGLVAAQWGDAPGQDGDVLADLVAIQAVAAPKPHRYEQRSWELLAHARDARALKKAKTQASAASSNADSMAASLAAVGQQFPGVARALGLQV